jgi:hypothetical protein
VGAALLAPIQALHESDGKKGAVLTDDEDQFLGANVDSGVERVWFLICLF